MKEEQNKPSFEEEITSLKRQLAGCKGRNKQLTQDVEKWKAYGKEADEMYDKRLTEIDELKKDIECKDGTIELRNKSIAGLESQTNALKETIAERNETIRQLRDDIAVYRAQIEYYNDLPWWKRIWEKV